MVSCPFSWVCLFVCAHVCTCTCVSASHGSTPCGIPPEQSTLCLWQTFTETDAEFLGDIGYPVGHRPPSVSAALSLGILAYFTIPRFIFMSIGDGPHFCRTNTSPQSSHHQPLASIWFKFKNSSQLFPIFTSRCFHLWFGFLVIFQNELLFLYIADTMLYDII